MQQSSLFRWLKPAVLLLALCSLVSGDRITLKDGTVLEGTVITQDNSYWVKTPDGKSRIIPFADVQSVTSGSAVAPGASASFAAAKSQAEAVDSPSAALAIWQKYLEGKPTEADRANANAELEKWKKLASENAQKINGKWVGGPELKQLLDRSAALCNEASEMIKNNQTLAAVKKLEEAIKIYPNNYAAISSLGSIALVSGKENDAARHFEHCLRLSPNACDALNNLGVVMARKREFSRAIDLLYRAVKIEDNKALAQNLINTLEASPPSLRDLPRFKPAIDAARLLAAKHQIASATTQFHLLPPKSQQPGIPGSPDNGTPGAASAGTGFVLNEDGLILTNRHVVEKGKNFMVLLPGNVQKPAEIVKIDEELDLALIKVKTDTKLQPVSLASTDYPPEGAQCFVLGFPLLFKIGATLKITQGIVSGQSNAPSGVDLLVDAKVNPGNSGGPLVNSHAQVIGIITMKSGNTQTEDSYGMAISAGKIRKFLERNNVKPTVAASSANAPVLNAEQVVAKLKQSTVCVLSMR